MIMREREGSRKIKEQARSRSILFAPRRAAPPVRSLRSDVWLRLNEDVKSAAYRSRQVNWQAAIHRKHQSRGDCLLVRSIARLLCTALLCSAHSHLIHYLGSVLIQPLPVSRQPTEQRSVRSLHRSTVQRTGSTRKTYVDEGTDCDPKHHRR